MIARREWKLLFDRIGNGVTQVTGDWDALIVPLYKEEYNKLVRVAYRLTGNMETAEDLVHNTFLLAYFNIEKFSVHPKPKAWLMTTLINLVKNENRRMSNQNLSINVLLNIPADQPPTRLSELLPTHLPAADQQLLIWRFEQQLDYREIAERLGISETGCRSRVSRALTRCRELLDNVK